MLGASEKLSLYLKMYLKIVTLLYLHKPRFGALSEVCKCLLILIIQLINIKQFSNIKSLLECLLLFPQQINLHQ